MVEKAQVVVPHLLGDLVDRQFGVGQQKAGLVHPLQDQQLFEGAASLPFDVSAQVIGVKAEVPGGGLQSGGEVVLFNVLQNFHNQAGVAAAGRKGRGRRKPGTGIPDF